MHGLKGLGLAALVAAGCGTESGALLGTWRVVAPEVPSEVQARAGATYTQEITFAADGSATGEKTSVLPADGQHLAGCRYTERSYWTQWSARDGELQLRTTRDSAIEITGCANPADNRPAAPAEELGASRVVELTRAYRIENGRLLVTDETPEDGPTAFERVD